jgi:tRNA threonylcarbamoyladenosine biosynthesis protein TsaE
LTLELTSHSPQQTIAIGEQLGKLLAPGDVICLSGDLGAGKTALTSGIAKGWGALEPVNSPTFVFIHEHQRAGDDSRLYHVDCYRLGSEADALSIGLEDVLAGSDVVILEWPERAASLLPVERLWITLEALEAETDRRLDLEAVGERYGLLLEKLEGLIPPYPPTPVSRPRVRGSKEEKGRSGE